MFFSCGVVLLCSMLIASCRVWLCWVVLAYIFMMWSFACLFIWLWRNSFSLFLAFCWMCGGIIPMYMSCCRICWVLGPAVVGCGMSACVYVRCAGCYLYIYQLKFYSTLINLCHDPLIISSTCCLQATK